MLTFEEKQDIIDAFPQLTKKEVSMKRLNYHFEDSLYDKKIVVQHLHPNGNGFIYLEDVPGYETDTRGLVNIREASADELRQMVEDAIEGLSMEIETIVERWTDGQNVLILQEEFDAWGLYHEGNLEDSFGDYEEAVQYLKEERFTLEEEA